MDDDPDDTNRFSKGDRIIYQGKPGVILSCSKAWYSNGRELSDDYVRLELDNGEKIYVEKGNFGEIKPARSLKSIAV